MLTLEKVIWDAPRIAIRADGNWSVTPPASVGVYAIWRGDDLIYVGESCHLKHRLSDLVHGNHRFKWNAAQPSIEELVQHFRVSFIYDILGRKELEEFLTGRWLPKIKFLRRRLLCDDIDQICKAPPLFTTTFMPCCS